MMTSPADRGPEIITARLRLRRWKDSDRLPFAQLNADMRVMRFLRGPYSSAKSFAGIDAFEVEFDRRGFGRWALETTVDGGFIGMVGLHQLDFEAPFTPAVEIAWRLAFHAWGQGYATEAARAAVDYGFDTVGLDEIVALAAADNVRSRRVMERIGMRRNAADDFDHPRLPVGDPLRRHVLYRVLPNHRLVIGSPTTDQRGGPRC